MVSCNVKKASNIFSFATSELSHDAMICWLLSCLNLWEFKPDSAEYKIAIAFYEMLKQSENQLPKVPKRVDVYQQVESTDVLAVIDGTVALVIEDKIASRIHSNQLARYRQSIPNSEREELRGVRSHLFLFLKVGVLHQWEREGCEREKWKVVDWKNLEQFVEISSRIATNNFLVNCYLEHLADQFGERRLWQSGGDVDQWTWQTWEALLDDLCGELNANSHKVMFDWAWVNNSSGGFYALYDIAEGEEPTIYIQLEVGIGDSHHVKLVLRLGDVFENRIERRNSAIEEIEAASRIEGWNIVRPSRLGKGKTMAVGEVDGFSLIQGGHYRRDEVVSTISRIKQIVDRLNRMNKF